MSKILLVEDDNNLREIYEARLQAEGYAIVSAKDGEEALVVAKAEKPDLIISDVMMPKISGFEMLDILRNTPELKATRVVMLTALGQAEDQSRASHLGADRYLVKSQVTLEDIVKVTHELLNDLPEQEVASTEVMPSQAETSTVPQPVATPQEIAVSPAPAVEQPFIPTPVVEMPVEAPAPIDVPVVEVPQPVQEPMAYNSTPVVEMPVEAPASAPLTQSDEISIDASGQLAPTKLEPSVIPSQVPVITGTLAPENSASFDANQAANVETLVQAVNDLASDSTQTPQEATTNESSSPNLVPGDSSATDYLPSSAISGKKIIQPMGQQPQKSLDELLAIEEAQQPATLPVPASPTLDVMDPNAAFNPSDPNNIAL